MNILENIKDFIIRFHIDIFSIRSKWYLGLKYSQYSCKHTFRQA